MQLLLLFISIEIGEYLELEHSKKEKRRSRELKG